MVDEGDEATTSMRVEGRGAVEGFFKTTKGLSKEYNFPRGPRGGSVRDGPMRFCDSIDGHPATSRFCRTWRGDHDDEVGDGEDPGIEGIAVGDGHAQLRWIGHKDGSGTARPIRRWREDSGMDSKVSSITMSDVLGDFEIGILLDGGDVLAVVNFENGTFKASPGFCSTW